MRHEGQGIAACAIPHSWLHELQPLCSGREAFMYEKSRLLGVADNTSAELSSRHSTLWYHELCLRCIWLAVHSV